MQQFTYGQTGRVSAIIQALLAVILVMVYNSGASAKAGPSNEGMEGPGRFSGMPS
jgi:hypothetical protein